MSQINKQNRNKCKLMYVKEPDMCSIKYPRLYVWMYCKLLDSHTEYKGIILFYSKIYTWW